MLLTCYSELDSQVEMISFLLRVLYLLAAGTISQEYMCRTSGITLGRVIRGRDVIGSVRNSSKNMIVAFSAAIEAHNTLEVSIKAIIQGV